MPLVNAVDPRVSFTELQQWPDDGRRYELYDGEAIMVPAPLPRHQLVVLRLSVLLLDFAEASEGLALVSPVDIVFTEHDVVQPDIVFFRKERRPLIDMMQAIRVAPDLAVEVLSRGTEARDRRRKKDTFARFSVPEYWIVDPVANTLEVYLLEGGGFTLAGVHGEDAAIHSPTLAGLAFDAARIFRE